MEVFAYNLRNNLFSSVLLESLKELHYDEINLVNTK